MKLHDFPRYPLTFGPSPIHPLDRPTKHLAGATLWAKREDRSWGPAFGGKKIRKLEYLVPDALAEGADTLVSIGGVQSNHSRPGRRTASRPARPSTRSEGSQRLLRHLRLRTTDR